MQTLDVLQKRIKTTGDLLAVVKTMKSLAAANTRHFDRAAQSIVQYAHVVENGWTVLFRSGGVMLPSIGENEAVILVVGSDQGMCGQFNELIMQAGLAAGERLAEKRLKVTFWTAGDRVRAALEDVGEASTLHFPIPGTLGGIDQVAGDLMERMSKWKRRGIGQFHIVYNAQQERQGYSPTDNRILPLNKQWEKKLAAAEWPGRCLPQTFLPGEALFSELFSQYLFISLYGALAQSMAAENAARLAAMYAAEKNIEDMREELLVNFRQTRQNDITEELLDIIAGFEALT